VCWLAFQGAGLVQRGAASRWGAERGVCSLEGTGGVEVGGIELEGALEVLDGVLQAAHVGGAALGGNLAVDRVPMAQMATLCAMMCGKTKRRTG
jgi:hypothetical protein